jgi:hypothetical protein
MAQAMRSTTTPYFGQRSTRIDRPGFEGPRRRARSSAQDASRDSRSGQRFSFAGGVEGIYNRADFLEQRRELLEKWADYCAGRDSQRGAAQAAAA